MSTAQATAIHDRYRKSFVGRARATRDLALLDEIIADTERLAAEVTATDLRATLAERLGLYRTERTEIAAIQAGGPDALVAWRLVEWSEVTFSRYLREFAGHARPTRDVALLGEMAAELRGWIDALPNLDDARLRTQRAQMESNLRLFTDELAAIPASRSALAPSDQGRVYAGAANVQFGLYRRHFQGKARATRRPALLRRIITGLEGIHAGMVHVRELGVRTDIHDGNITRVADRLAHHRDEVARIVEARTQVSAIELGRSLGDEANKLFAAYRAEFSGKPRDSRDLDRLSELCDALQETARTMLALDEERHEGNGNNIAVVLEHLKMAEREHVTIREARKPKAN